MFIRTQTNGDRTYLLLVENERVDGRIKQRVLHRLGRLDELRTSGELDRLLASLGRFSEKYAVLGAHANGESLTTRSQIIGPALIFERLWQETGIGEVVRELAAPRRFQFSLERAVFLSVLHRLFAPGSDRAAEKWKEDYVIAGAEDLALHQFYRAMGWLGEPVEATDAASASVFGLRTRKDLIEETLFARRRDLFTRLDLVFFDTTSIYFEGEGGESLGQNGHSKDHRPDLKQMVVGMVLDNEGHPLCSEMWPGNTTDVTSLIPVVDRLRRRFNVHEVCVVADRGMISAPTIEKIKTRGWRYILGVRMRRTKEANAIVLARAGRYEEVFAKSADAKAPSPLKVKEVWVDERRYVVCLNEDEATKDRHDREAIVAALREALKQGDKSLIGNRGYRRFVKTAGERFTIDEQRIRDEARFDGKWVLTTNTELSARELALKYKQLWMVEAIFRTMKSELATRPIFHKVDDTIRGHVFCTFLALLLRKELEHRLERHGWTLEWADVIRDLDRLQAIEIRLDGKGYVLRTETKGTTGKVFQACGVALPPTLRAC
ncbi:MAG TPA: IS1634 family transposase [Casimicrobiaceae bacterium]|nr:IS1634 family transposase [Casimicrobiaceae bacterium]